MYLRPIGMVREQKRIGNAGPERGKLNLFLIFIQVNRAAVRPLIRLGKSGQFTGIVEEVPFTLEQMGLLEVFPKLSLPS
ncbi:MAG: hypothetical protein ACOYOS_22065 [Syntrophales bacterium]